MDPRQQQAPQPPKKLVDFNGELEALCKKYQYELRPVLQFDPIRGIFAILQAFEVSPLDQDQGVPLNPTAPADKPADAPVDPVANVNPSAPLAPSNGNSEVVEDAKKNAEGLNGPAVPSQLAEPNAPVDKPGAN